MNKIAPRELTARPCERCGQPVFWAIAGQAGRETRVPLSPYAACYIAMASYEANDGEKKLVVQPSKTAFVDHSFVCGGEVVAVA